MEIERRYIAACDKWAEIERQRMLAGEQFRTLSKEASALWEQLAELGGQLPPSARNRILKLQFGPVERRSSISGPVIDP